MGVPIGAVALVVGVTRAFGWVELREVVSSISWDVLALVVGFFLVVRAAEGGGLGELARASYVAVAPGDGFPQILAVAYVTALGSNVLSNLPRTLVALDALGPLISEGQLGAATIYATIVGTGVGPNLTVVGSLATLI